MKKKGRFNEYGVWMSGEDLKYNERRGALVPMVIKLVNELVPRYQYLKTSDYNTDWNRVFFSEMDKACRERGIL